MQQGQLSTIQIICERYQAQCAVVVTDPTISDIRDGLMRLCALTEQYIADLCGEIERETVRIPSERQAARELVAAVLAGSPLDHCQSLARVLETIAASPGDG